MAQVTQSLVELWIRQTDDGSRPQYTVNEFRQLCYAWQELQRLRPAQETRPESFAEKFNKPMDAAHSRSQQRRLEVQTRPAHTAAHDCACEECVKTAGEAVHGSTAAPRWWNLGSLSNGRCAFAKVLTGAACCLPDGHAGEHMTDQDRATANRRSDQ